MPTPETRPTTLYTYDTGKAYVLGSTAPSTLKDEEEAILTQCLDRASQMMESLTGWTFVERDIIETVDGGCRKVFLTTTPVQSVEEVEVLINDEWTPLDDWRAHGGQVLIDAPPGWHNVRITYTAGFDAQDGDDLPADIFGAALDIAKALWDERKSGAIAASSYNVGGSNVILKPALPYHVRSVIDAWKRVDLA